MTDHDRNNSRRWRISGEIVFVPFLACFAVIIFHSVLFAVEDRDAIRKSIRMTAHDDFGGTNQPAERLAFRFSGKTSQWIPIQSLESESEAQSK